MPLPEGTRPTVVIVARFFPAHDEPGRGAFVAHQAEAVLAIGRERPMVVAFDDVRLAGSVAAQATAAAAVVEQVRRASARGASPVAPQGVHGPAGVPVLRLRVPHLSASGRAGDVDGLWHARVAAVASEAWPADDPRLARGLVHAHEAYPDGLAAREIARACGWPLVVTEHASYVASLLADPAIREDYVAVAEAAHRLVVVSETLAATIRRLAPELADRIVIIPNAVPTDLFTLGDPGARRPDELLYVGARRPEKGTETLLAAFATVRRSRPAARLRLIGTAPGGDEPFRAMAAALGIADSVAFEGPTDRAGIAAAMRAASLFVHPSPAETFGVVAAEALSTGLPVVSADSGGVTELLGPGEGPLGIIVERRSPEALARGILAALDHQAAFDPAVLRRSITERFDAHVVGTRLSDLYDEARAAFDYPERGRRPPDPDGSLPGRVLIVGLDRGRALPRVAGLPGVASEPGPRGPTRIELVTTRPHDATAAARAAAAAAAHAAPPPAAAPATGRGQPEPSLGWVTVHVVDPAAALRRHRRWSRLPLLRRLEARRHGQGARADEAHETLQLVAVASEVTAIARRARVGTIVPIDGRDARVIEALPRLSGVAIAPGGLRWLADRLAASSGSVPGDPRGDIERPGAA